MNPCATSRPPSCGFSKPPPTATLRLPSRGVSEPPPSSLQELLTRHNEVTYDFLVAHYTEVGEPRAPHLVMSGLGAHCLQLGNSPLQIAGD
jgi:hypothetical protein